MNKRPPLEKSQEHEIDKLKKESVEKDRKKKGEVFSATFKLARFDENQYEPPTPNRCHSCGHRNIKPQYRDFLRCRYCDLHYCCICVDIHEPLCLVCSPKKIDISSD